MKHTTRGIRAAIAAGALGTAIFVGIGPAEAIVPIRCYYDEYQNWICPSTETRP